MENDNKKKIYIYIITFPLYYVLAIQNVKKKNVFFRKKNQCIKVHYFNVNTVFGDEK